MTKKFEPTGKRFLKWEELESKTFERNGMEVAEKVVQKEDGGFKLLWCRTPLEETVIDGEANPIFHKDYVSGVAQDIARRKVEEAFDQYWGATKEERIHYWETKSMPKGQIVTEDEK